MRLVVLPPCPSVMVLAELGSCFNCATVRSELELTCSLMLVNVRLCAEGGAGSIELLLYSSSKVAVFQSQPVEDSHVSKRQRRLYGFMFQLREMVRKLRLKGKKGCCTTFKCSFAVRNTLVMAASRKKGCCISLKWRYASQWFFFRIMMKATLHTGTQWACANTCFFIAMANDSTRGHLPDQ